MFFWHKMLDISAWKQPKPKYIINTQYMTNSTLVSPVKMEYVTKNNIFGLKMMMKCCLEKIILKSLHAQDIFY